MGGGNGERWQAVGLARDFGSPIGGKRGRRWQGVNGGTGGVWMDGIIIDGEAELGTEKDEPLMDGNDV